MGKGIETLDYSYANLRSVEKNVVECQKETKKLEVELLNVLATDQLELYSKLEKAIIAESLVDAKLYSSKLFETLDSEQFIACQDYFQSSKNCSEATQKYQSDKNEFENSKKSFLAIVKLLFDDPQLYNMLLIVFNQRYP